MAEAQKNVGINQSTLLSATTGKLDVYVLPLWQKKMLLPQGAVAEIISASQLKATKKNTSVGLLGQVTWEGEPLPVISFEAFNGDNSAPAPQKLAIVVAANLGEEHTHYALALQAEPTLNKIKIAQESPPLQSFPKDSPVFHKCRLSLFGHNLLHPQLLNFPLQDPPPEHKNCSRWPV